MISSNIYRKGHKKRTVVEQELHKMFKALERTFETNMRIIIQRHYENFV